MHIENYSDIILGDNLCIETYKFFNFYNDITPFDALLRVFRSSLSEKVHSFCT